MNRVSRTLALLALASSMAMMAWADQGVVMSTIDSAGYTYIEVQQEGQKVWLAVDPIKVSIGDKLQYEGGMTMTDFVSSSLTRTFPTMRFVEEVKVVAGVAGVPSSSVVPAK